MASIPKDLDTVPAFPWQWQVGQGERDQQRNVPAEREVVRDVGLEVAVEPEQLCSILIEDADFDGVLAIALSPVQEQADGDGSVKGGGQLAGEDRVEAAAKNIGETVPDLNGFGHHRPVELHRRDSYRGERITAPRR